MDFRRIREVFCCVWVHFFTDAGPAAERPVSQLETPLQSTHSRFRDQIVMHESLQ
jgi:hypothetical protein